MILVRNPLLSLTLFVRGFLLFCESRFVCRARSPCALALLLHDESLGDQISETLFCNFPVASLAASVARCDSNRTGLGYSGRQPRLDSGAIFIPQRARSVDVSLELYSRGGLIDVLSACARGSRCPEC